MNARNQIGAKSSIIVFLINLQQSCCQRTKLFLSLLWASLLNLILGILTWFICKFFFCQIILRKRLKIWGQYHQQIWVNPAPFTSTKQCFNFRHSRKPHWFNWGPTVNWLCRSIWSGRWDQQQYNPAGNNQ